MKFNKKLFIYAGIPLATLGLIGVGSASAHNWFAVNNATPKEVAERQTQMFELEANLLGITIDEAKNYWAQGKSIREIAEEKGISESELRTKMQEQAKVKMQEQLNTLVSQGVITQAQADQRLQSIQNRQQEGGSRRGMMKGFGGHGFDF